MNHRLFRSKFLLGATAALTAGACSTTHDIGDNSEAARGATGGAPATSCPTVEPKNADACGKVGLFCSYGAFSCPYHYTCNANGVFERDPVSGCYPFPGAGGTTGAGGNSGGYPGDGGNTATGGSGPCDDLQSAVGTCTPLDGGTGGTGNDLGSGGSTATGGIVGSGGAFTGGNTSSSGGTTATGGTSTLTSVTIGIASAKRVDLTPITSSGATIVAPQNSGLRVDLTTSAPVYQLTCTGGSVLTKGNGSAILDQRPRCGASPYYLADTYVANSLVPACMGCDQIFCQALITPQTFVTYDIVKTSDRSVGDASTPLGVYEIRPSTGPYLLTISYYTDAKCATTVRSTGPMLIDVDANGSTATGGSSGL